MTEQVQTEDKVKRGFCGRNGRGKILDKIFESASTYSNTNAMYDESCRQFTEAGIPVLKKTSFAAMFSTWKRKQQPKQQVTSVVEPVVSVAEAIVEEVYQPSNEFQKSLFDSSEVVDSSSQD